MSKTDELIEEKDIGDLKKKGKKFKFSIKRTLLGVLCASIIWSTIPNMEYNLARIQASNNQYITSVLEDISLSKEKKIAQIYETALRENNNIPDDIKELLVESFTKEVINHAGTFFSEDTIRNMYAVAKTEKVTLMSGFAKEHGWWSGDYNSYTNTIDVMTFSDHPILAHEQLHAILKDGLFGTGLTSGIEGYGINEGATAFFGNTDSAYYSENNIINTLGFIIGYDDLLCTYTNSDLLQLKMVLCQYISPQETNELIYKIDLNVFQNYFEVFLVKNNISYDKDNMDQSMLAREQRIREIIKDIFKAKHGVSMEDSKLGQLIMNSFSFMTIDQISFDKLLYDITYNDKDSVRIKFINIDFVNGVAKIIIKSDLGLEHFINNEEIKHEISNIIDVSDVDIISISKRDDNIEITLSAVEFVVDNDKLEDFNYEKEYADIQAKVQEHNKLYLETHNLVRTKK